VSDFESFGGFDAGGESYDPASFERFKERMKVAAAQIKIIKKQEKKQKKSEDELVRILVKFIKNGKQKDILILVSRLLEMNVPASFLVAVLLISNKEIQEEVGINLLPSSAEGAAIKSKGNLPDLYIGESLLPLRIKIAIISWINEIDQKINDNPARCIKSLYNEQGGVNNTAIQLCVFCLRDFLNSNSIDHDYDKQKNFVSFFLKDLLLKAKNGIKKLTKD